MFHINRCLTTYSGINRLWPSISYSRSPFGWKKDQKNIIRFIHFIRKIVFFFEILKFLPIKKSVLFNLSFEMKVCRSDVDFCVAAQNSWAVIQKVNVWWQANQIIFFWLSIVNLIAAFWCDANYLVGSNWSQMNIVCMDTVIPFQWNAAWDGRFGSRKIWFWNQSHDVCRQICWRFCVIRIHRCFFIESLISIGYLGTFSNRIDWADMNVARGCICYGNSGSWRMYLMRRAWRRGKVSWQWLLIQPNYVIHCWSICSKQFSVFQCLVFIF